MTRQIWAGAGQWDKKTGRYLLSQRAEALESVLGKYTTQRRPLIHLKDEALCDDSQWQRIHVLAGDANLAETVTWLKLATTALVLRIVEEAPSRRRCLQPYDFEHAIDNVNCDLGGTGRYRTTGGKYPTALDVQRWYLERAAAVLDRNGGPQWQHDAVSWWARLLDLLEHDGPGGLVGVVDWATKLNLLEQVAARQQGGMASDKVAYCNLRYHDIHDGYARKLETDGKLQRLTHDDDIDTARRQPPPGGRAQVRGSFIEAMTARKVHATANWDTLWVGSDCYRGLRDPFNCNLGGMHDWVDLVLARQGLHPG
jgi:proteasome accessory factor A